MYLIYLYVQMLKNTTFLVRPKLKNESFFVLYCPKHSYFNDPLAA